MVPYPLSLKKCAAEEGGEQRERRGPAVAVTRHLVVSTVWATSSLRDEDIGKGGRPWGGGETSRCAGLPFCGVAVSCERG